MSYSRANPSPRYQLLIEQYCRLHEEGEQNLGLSPAQTFNGKSLLPQLERVRTLIRQTDAATILDYGSGKGEQYASRLESPGGGNTSTTVVDYWEIDEVCCYDPCFPPFSQLPDERFDGVISTDVLEHCPEEDLPWIVDEIFGHARRFVFSNIAAYPARKHLPNGENAHCTVRPAQWWGQLFDVIGSNYPEVRWEVWVSTRGADGALQEQRVANFEMDKAER